MSLLIKDVQIVDGTGKEAHKADVLVQKGIISSVGNLKERGAGKTIEGLGNYLAPGFIDAHARSDHYLSLFSNPKQESLVKQGVTTILCGSSGISLAPLLYGVPNALTFWSNARDINVNWHTVGEFLSQFENRKLGINFGTLVGHSTLRRELVGSRKTLDKKELVILRRLVEESLDQGAYGISSDPGSVYGSGASAREIAEISMAAREEDVVHVVGLRSVRNMKESVEEIIKLAKLTGAKVIIDNFRPTKGSIKEFKEALTLLETVSERLDIRFLLQPYELSEVPVYMFLPPALRKTGRGAMLARVRNEKNRKIIHQELSGVDFRGVCVASAPHHHFLVGKSIKQIADNWGVNYIEAMQKLMDVSDLRATVFYADASKVTLRSLLGDERALITSNSSGVLPGGGYTENMEGAQTFPDYLRSVVAEGLLSFEDAIKKITSIPADLFGIEGKGVIEEGRSADLVLLSKDNYEIKQVILGGEVFGEDKLRGEVLKHYR